MNYTLGPEGLVSSTLFFGEFPQVCRTSEDTRSQASLLERAEISSLARKDMEKQMEKLRASRALHYAVPPRPVFLTN